MLVTDRPGCLCVKVSIGAPLTFNKFLDHTIHQVGVIVN